MHHFIKRIYDKLRLFLEIDWITTIWFNLSKLPYRQALRLPILLYNSKIKPSTGSIILNIPFEELKFGMIKLGCCIEDACLSRDGLVLSNNGTIIINGSGFIGNGSAIVVRENAILTLGRNFGITGNFKLHCYESISIGDWFSSAWDVSISDTDFHLTKDPYTNIQNSFTKRILIGNNVWICQKATILKGAGIPDFYTVGACSLVNKKFPPNLYTVIGGSPAKEISKLKRVDFELFNKRNIRYITIGLAIFNL